MCKLWPKPYVRNADDITRTVTPFPHPAHRTGLPNGEGDGAPDNSISCWCSPDEVIVWAFANIPVNEWPEPKNCNHNICNRLSCRMTGMGQTLPCSRRTSTTA